jgi:exonuclease VII small subunit
MEDRDKLERTIEMLRYSIEMNENQMAMYQEGDLEWKYAKKIVDSCRETLAQKEKEMQELLAAPPPDPKGPPPA